MGDDAAAPKGLKAKLMSCLGKRSESIVDAKIIPDSPRDEEPDETGPSEEADAPG